MYQEEHKLLADGGRWEETKTATERNYEGLRLRLTHQPQFGDEAFPDTLPTKIEMTRENWDELLSGQPMAPGKRRKRCQSTLAYKLMRASTAGTGLRVSTCPRVNRLLDRVKRRSNVIYTRGVYTWCIYAHPSVVRGAFETDELELRRRRLMNKCGVRVD